MFLLFEILAVERVDQCVCDDGAFGLLEMLDYAVGLERIGYGAAEFIYLPSASSNDVFQIFQQLIAGRGNEGTRERRTIYAR